MFLASPPGPWASGPWFGSSRLPKTSHRPAGGPQRRRYGTEAVVVIYVGAEDGCPCESHCFSWAKENLYVRAAVITSANSSPWPVQAIRFSLMRSRRTWASSYWAC
jgi:hypothetical protein